MGKRFRVSRSSFPLRWQPPGLAQQDQVPLICKLKTKTSQVEGHKVCSRGVGCGAVDPSFDTACLFWPSLMILPTFLLSLLLLGRRNVAGRSSKSECNRRLIAFSLPAQQRSSPEEVQGRAEKRRDIRTEFVSHWEVPNRMVALTDSDIQHVRKGPPKRRNIKKIPDATIKVVGRLSTKNLWPHAIFQCGDCRVDNSWPNAAPLSWVLFNRMNKASSR